MIPDYKQLYLDDASRTVGNMLHDAVLEYGLDGTDFLERFIQSGIAAQFEAGNPKYLAGKSGQELFLEVMEKTSGTAYPPQKIESFTRSDVYWVGWMLVHYQWHSGKSFREILHIVPYNDFICLYPTLHEADINKGYEVLDRHFAGLDCKLKAIRMSRALTQEQLAKESGVSLPSIRAYEQKAKDIRKARADILLRLAAVLNCDIQDLL